MRIKENLLLHKLLSSPSSFSLSPEVAGALPFVQLFSRQQKRRKTVCVFAYVVFFILNPIQEASASFGASAGASTEVSASSSVTGTPKVLISGKRSRNQLLMTG